MPQTGAMLDFALMYVRDHYPSDTQFVEDVLHVLEQGDRQQIALALR